MTNEEIAKLLNLTVEQVEAISKKLGPKVLPSAAKILDDSSNYYWRVEDGVEDGYFVCMVSYQDAQTPEQALDVAHSSLEPWYFVGHQGVGRVSRIPRSEYIDWLRHR